MANPRRHAKIATMGYTKELLLFRHAKSSRDDPDLDDFDRPLAERGVKDAPLMGREMAARGWIPQLALVSPAARTTETWKLAGAALPAAPKVRSPESLYLATSSRILTEIAKTPETVERLVVVGHNPGMEELARMLAGQRSDEAARRLVDDKFPTGALARFTFSGEWKDLAAGGTALTHFLRPKDLG
jgi:phosphohistidine phosphatase